MQDLRVGVVGATGAVGREMLHVLARSRLPIGEVRLLGSERSAGRDLETPFGRLSVQEARPEAFAGLDLALFAAGSEAARRLAPSAAQAGVLVVDNSSAFRLEPEVPLVVPEVNPEAARRHRGILANPNCTTIIFAVAVWPLVRQAGLVRAVVSTYQAVSGVGRRGLEALERESRAMLDGRTPEPGPIPYAGSARPRPIAFNVVPQVDRFEDKGYTKEEWKLVRETRKIFSMPDAAINATTVRVPVFRCHAESVNLQFERPLSPEQARALLAEAPGVVVCDDPGSEEYPTPLEVSGRDEVFVGRIRVDPTAPNTLNLWVVGDQLLKGAALNAVQIAELVWDEGGLGA